jgi:hypothetical protein
MATGDLVVPVDAAGTAMPLVRATSAVMQRSCEPGATGDSALGDDDLALAHPRPKPPHGHVSVGTLDAPVVPSGSPARVDPSDSRVKVGRTSKEGKPA